MNTGWKMYRLAVLLGAMIVALSTGVANASTALLLGGKGVYAKLTEQQMAEAFGGYFADYDRRVNVPFPGKELYSSVAKGADNLYAAVYDPAYAGPKTIGGVSEGAPSVMEVLRRLEADRANTTDGKEPPPPSELNVAIYGAPSKRFLGKLADLPTPVTPYDVLIVKTEYDGLADFPDNTWNMLAVSNAVMGAMTLHVKNSNFDIRNNPTEYTIEVNSAGGTTTTILIPAEVLPILAPMVAFHFDPKFVAALDSKLRPIIDSAYNRPPMETGIPPTLTGPPAPKPTTTTLVAETAAKPEDDAPTPTRSLKRATSWKDAVTRRQERIEKLREAVEAKKSARNDDSDAEEATKPAKTADEDSSATETKAESAKAETTKSEPAKADKATASAGGDSE
ncbi:putative PPE family protein PPE42 [Mycolicibacterium chubuense]|uniref:Putative PPE family protein PPE42 n=2 Tax=Mycolicibacterium chubuense TaxID=1800 RepID=A0A0J6WNI3_MYCCU|nr:putative PPE family protein PPE42 [Mycolicibacterium chubuense]SPX99837.1 PE-PPE domain-containing protein [Mycolicibacterium chubuense]